MLKHMKLSDIHANPYRSFDTYKIIQEKIDNLKESYDATGFWAETLVARKRKGGGYELAFGHHRWQTALEMYEPDMEISISVRPLDNDQMLKMMSRENNDVYNANAQMDIELVKSAIEAHARGEITLPAVEKKTRNAKGLNTSDYFQSTENSEPFTAKGLAEYLGQPQWRANEALGHLRQIHKGESTIEDYEGLTPTQAQDMKTQINRAPLSTKRKVAKAVGSAVRAGKAKTNTSQRSGGNKSATIKSVAQKVINKETGLDTPLQKIMTDYKNTRNKLEAARQSLNRLLDQMEELNITGISGPEVYDFNQTINRLDKNIKAYRARCDEKSTPKLVSVK